MMQEAEALLEAARAAGALEAEVFVKIGRGRKVVLEPAVRSGSPPIETVSDSEEEGMALRVIDRAGRRGFAWVGLPAPERAGDSLLGAAFASARHDRGGAPGVVRPPLGPGPRNGPGRSGVRIADPECMALSAERIAALLLETAAGADGRAVAIDRLALSEAMTTVALANSRGFRGSYSKSLAFLSVALIPAEPGAAAVVEERSACRLADLDPRDCLREALQRTKPARRSVEETTAGRAAPLLLTARASASFLAAITPCALSGEASLWKGSTLRIVDDQTMDGRPGSAPFDGAGYDTRRTVLVGDGSAVGRLSADGGNFIRPSYRDLPVVGVAGLLILPADSHSGMDAGSPAPSDDTLMLQVSAIEVVPGPVCSVRIRRGDWWSGGKALGPADGLGWEGPLAVLLRGASPAGTEVKFYHCGAPLGAPSLRIDGLTPLRVEAPGRSAVSV